MQYTTPFSMLLLLLTSLVCLSTSAVVEHTWNITWVTANPDGRLTRPVISINNAWPPPAVHVNKGDRLIVHVNNDLGNETTTIHWHGLFQEGSNAMDGPSMVNQCPIPPGMSFTYNFTIDQPGTYWYHSHDREQYPDGLRGALIVHDPQAPFADQVDGELVLVFSDWYHQQMPKLLPFYLNETQNTDGAEPVPYSALLNDVPSGQSKLSVEPNKTYLLRIISVATFAQSAIWIDDHQMTVVEADGVYTEPKLVESVYVATGQRYSVLITTKAVNGSVAYPIHALMDGDKFDSIPDYTVLNTTAYLVYNEADQGPTCGKKSVTYLPPQLANISDLHYPNDIDFVPYDHMPALCGKPDHSVSLDLSFFNDFDMNLAGFNNVTYIAPRVPTLYSILNAPSKEAPKLRSAKVYGAHTNAWVVGKGDLVEIVVNNYDDGAHVMHLHGHNVQLLSIVEGVHTTDSDSKGKIYESATNCKNLPRYPMRRDSWVLPASGYSIVRFIADNPGVWLFHCHMEWHVAAGMVANIITAPEILRSTQSIDPDMTKVCAAGGIPTAGNGAGHIDDYFNLNGQPMQPEANFTGALVS